MIDVKAYVAGELAKLGLPVIDELLAKSSTPIPCITYTELSNSDLILGNTIEYGQIVWTVKVWSGSIAILEQYAALVDATMKDQGFSKTTSFQTFNNGIGQYVMRFTATGYQDK
jgi:hypothetical protein